MKHKQTKRAFDATMEEMWQLLRRFALIPRTHEEIRWVEEQMKLISYELPERLQNSHLLLAKVSDKSNLEVDSGYQVNKAELKYYHIAHKKQQWGSFWVINPSRTERPQPLHKHSCAFCGILGDIEDTRDMNEILFEKKESYYVIENNNPIIKNQLLVFPESLQSPRKFYNDRVVLKKSDIKLSIKLAREGFSKIRLRVYEGHNALINSEAFTSFQEQYAQHYAIYLNPTIGTGRTESHVHLNLVQAQNLPLLKAEAVPWQICGEQRNVAFSRIANIPFYALLVEGPSDEILSEVMERFHELMNEVGIPYNLLIYPELNTVLEPKIKIVVVPRSSEYAEACGQKLGGLEFLTGVLIPDNKHQNMDSLMRDLAFQQTTLESGEQLKFERLLRQQFGMPDLGLGVFSISERHGENKFLPKVGENKSLEINDCWVNPTDCKSSEDKKFKIPNVLIRITRAGICQSDRRVMLGNKPGTLDQNWALGHEGGGYIIDPGPHTDLNAGDKVVVLPHVTCMECAYCLNYKQNLCENMKHLGFHSNGNMVQMMNYFYQSIFRVDENFPSDALTLVEPLACVLRALFRLKTTVPKLEGTFGIFGAGPMGCLAAMAVKHLWPKMKVRMIEPLDARREVVRKLRIADELVASSEEVAEQFISFIATSKLKAAEEALLKTQNGGIILLFSGINTEEFESRTPRRANQGRFLESIHREEHIVQYTHPLGRYYTLIGSSGYNYDDIVRSVSQLTNHHENQNEKHYENYYKKIQNAEILGLDAMEVKYSFTSKKRRKFENSVEALLSPLGVEDEIFGNDIAEAIKVLIKI